MFRQPTSTTTAYASRASVTPKQSIRPLKKHIDATSKQNEIFDWIQNFIVPALVEMYIQERMLNREETRG